MRIRDWMKRRKTVPPSQLTAWQQIFLLSKVNNESAYIGDRLPSQPWSFPRNTWLQDRLNKKGQKT